MRSFKRNAVIITVVLFVCVAAYLNWSYSKDAAQDVGATIAEPTTTSLTPNVGIPENPDAADDNNAGSSGLFFSGDAGGTAAFFAEARINRRQARDAAVETLASVNGAEGASQEVLDAALEKITAIAAFGQKEAELEALVRAKGFSDCVAFMSADGVKITVPAPQAGLSAVDVAKITDIVTGETDFTAEALQIIPVN
ncbi:MAG: SpoIIIAH-like family protein [Oscillospiraceae bacterium]|jgi:stage III sporulation protein AH|nr:SpoIIIAH-like family protein [Oscillospiraceae bacterium]